ncbi:DUF1127 domain-containing protein [Oryzicola mucosus]|uniref:DUF1127 domain-containing protein n=1 Tax=Oryzicola mucosus TaxID=2767425 RepID=A0A8J6U7P9_9HYPH|nr:DUF1127 domain-containing protein [Oryzicola mucosus]MBD0415032.1 DUF1127 domain-containing protein [Oryzicola mucosus]
MSIRTKFREWRLYRQTVDELSRCTNRDLSDLGIQRSDIRFVAKASARAARFG